MDAKVLEALSARGLFPEIFPSSNFNERPAGEPVSAAVLHFTALDFEQSVHHLTRKETGVSTHYLIDRNGSLSQLVPVDLRSWHAGVGCLYDSRDVNGVSVGIDLVFVPNGNSRYEEAQYRTLALLLSALRETLPIRPEHIVGHEHVALPPGRKNDPGPTFNWKRVFRDQQLEIPPDWCQWERP
jgi:N-acetyl-anhydromuramyl-L-alanine amidase AmpD